MASTNFFRCKQTRRNLVIQGFKVGGNLIEPEAEVAGHVFEKYECWFNFANDSMDVRPKVSRIVFSTTSAGETEGLARVARSDAIHCSTPRAAVEGSQIRPKRRLIQATCFHRLSQVFDGEGFPLHPTDCANWEDKLEAQVKSCPAGTEG